MPRPHTPTGFINSSRAIVRQAPWMEDRKMPQRVAPELKPLVKLANEQGWKVEAAHNGTKLSWRGPNGEGPVFTGYRCQGRELMNYRAELVRAGLKLDETQAKSHVEDQQVAQMVDDATENPMSMEELDELMRLMMSQLSTLHAKAGLFDRAKADVEEWQQIAQEAQDVAEKSVKKIDELETVIGAVRECFKLSPWAILGEIAKLLDIDVGSPMQSGPTIHNTPKVSVK